MRYLSVCSGIEAATVAWHPLGWEPVAFCEIEPFPSAVLKEKYPHVPNYGDFTRLSEPDHPIRSAGVDLLVGGTPCQAFSVAGLRRGLADPRGGLTLEFVRLAQALRPRWIVWENVPGVLSQDGGRAFGAFLGALGELGYGWAYRVLDAQYFGVAQRRRRVFVIACAGGRSERAAAVLFEPEGVRRDPPTRGEAREGATSDAQGGADGGSVAGTVSSKWSKGTGGPAGDEHYNLTVAVWTGDGIVADPLGTNEGRAWTNEGANNFRLHNCVQQSVCATGDWTQALTTRSAAEEDGTGLGTDFDLDGGLVADGAGRDGGVVVARESGQGYWMEDTVAGTLRAEGEDRPSRPSHVVGHVVAPPLTATNDPSRSPQSSEVTAQVHAVLQAQTIAHPDVSATVSSKWAKGTDGFAGMTEHHNLTATFWNGNDIAETLTRTSDDQRMPDKGRMQMVVQPVVPYDLFQVTAPINRQNRDTTSPRHTLARDNAAHAAVVQSMAVRRLTPRECERLQGFPDDYTRIPWKKKPADECPDGPRYKALGNSMAVPVMRWIGERIAKVEKV